MVANPRQCIIIGKNTEPIKLYVCGDGSVEKAAGDCPTTTIVTPTICEPCEIVKAETSTILTQDTTSTVTISTSTSTVLTSSINPTTTVEEPAVETDCMKLGCSKDAVFVGSVNSDKYHPCNCHWALRIKAENIICFTGESDAESQGYTRSSGC